MCFLAFHIIFFLQMFGTLPGRHCLSPLHLVVSRQKMLQMRRSMPGNKS